MPNIWTKICHQDKSNQLHRIRNFDESISSSLHLIKTIKIIFCKGEKYRKNQFIAWLNKSFLQLLHLEIIFGDEKRNLNKNELN